MQKAQVSDGGSVEGVPAQVIGIGLTKDGQLSLELVVVTPGGLPLAVQTFILDRESFDRVRQTTAKYWPIPFGTERN